MEYILLITVVALLVERFVNETRHAKEREDLIRAILSKDATDYAVSKKVEQETVAQDTVVDKPEAFTPIEDVDDDKFMNALYGTNNEDQ